MRSFLGRCLDVLAEGVGNALMLAYVSVVVAAIVVLVLAAGWIGLLLAAPFAVMLAIFIRAGRDTLSS